MISSRMNEYLKSNFGYEIEGDLASLREAKVSLEAQKRELSADYQNRDYVETLLMLETIKSLLKVHNEQILEEKQRLDPKCWDGYKKQGTKMKGGVRVNNCVPESAKPDFLDLDKDGNKKEPMKKAIADKKKNKVEEAAERPYVCVHVKKGKHSCTAGSSYEAAKKAAAHWKLKSTSGIDAHLADVKHTATESVALKVDTNKKNYENSYKAPKEYKMKKTKLEEGLLAQLNALLEGDAAEAEITMAARGIVDELQDIIEKLGKIQNDQLGPLADEMGYTHGPEQADAFKASTDAAISNLLDTARSTKDEVNNAVLVLNGDAPASDMSVGKPELGGDMGDDFESDIEADVIGGDEAASGPVDEPLGRAKR